MSNLICENGFYREMTPGELAAGEEVNLYEEMTYEELVDYFIRERYTLSAELAILRQRDEKPEEYAIYYAYCEECKARAKEIKGIK